jgi:hypothetical protein
MDEGKRGEMFFGALKLNVHSPLRIVFWKNFKIVGPIQKWNPDKKYWTVVMYKILKIKWM